MWFVLEFLGGLNFVCCPLYSQSPEWSQSSGVWSVACETNFPGVGRKQRLEQTFDSMPDLTGSTRVFWDEIKSYIWQSRIMSFAIFESFSGHLPVRCPVIMQKAVILWCLEDIFHFEASHVRSSHASLKFDVRKQILIIIEDFTVVNADRIGGIGTLQQFECEWPDRTKDFCYLVSCQLDLQSQKCRSMST